MYMNAYMNAYNKVLENYWEQDKYSTRIFINFFKDIKQKYRNGDAKYIYDCSNYRDLFKKKSETWLLFNQLEKILNTNVEFFIHRFDNTMDIIIGENIKTDIKKKNI